MKKKQKMKDRHWQDKEELKTKNTEGKKTGKQEERGNGMIEGE